MTRMALFLALLTISWAGCDSLPVEQQSNPAMPEIIRSGQDWFEMQGAAVEYILPADGIPVTKGGAKKTRLEPDWDRAIELPFSETTSLLVVPVKDFTSTRIERRFIAEVKKGRVTNGYYLDFYGPSAASSGLNSLVVDWQMNGKISSGFHVVAQFSVKMKYKAGGVYRDGALLSRGAFQKKKRARIQLGRPKSVHWWKTAQIIISYWNTQMELR